MSNDNHDQSVGGQGATDGLSGTDNPGTEGADSGQGVNKGQHGHGGQPSGDAVSKPDGGMHNVGPGQSGMTGGGGLGGNTSKNEDEKNQPDSKE